uniref:Putative CRISPR-associated protein n=1 Tax=Ignisphaera aggregans TaxID=334771 RepID=A0A7C5XLI1_9CREN
MNKMFVVSAVGTSLLRNFVADGKTRDVVDRYKMVDWDRLRVDDQRNIYPDGYICQVSREESLRNPLKMFLSSNPRRYSAEINGIEAVLDLYPQPRSDIEILLYASQTCNSMLCAEVIKDVLKSMGYTYIDVVLVKALRSVDEFEEGVIELLDKVVRNIVEKSRKGYKVIVSATPGFKAETAFLSIASLLTEAPSIYIHESFNKPIQLPIIPIKIDIDKIKKVIDIFKEDRCIDKGDAIALYGLSEEVIENYRFMGIVEERREKGAICVRRWIQKVIELYIK